MHLGAQAHVAGKVSSPSLPSRPITSMALERAAAESALRFVSGSLDLPARSRVAPFRFASAMAWSGSCSFHHGVGVQLHLREEPPHVEVAGLLHHELGERAGADLGGHAHAGLAAVRLERLHEDQEPLRVVDLELEVRHGALAHGPLELGRVHVGVRVSELVGVHAAAAEDGVLGELELHEARHEGAAGEAVGPVQPDPGAQRIPQELEPCRPRPPLRACRGRARASRTAPPCPRWPVQARGEPSPSGGKS